MDSHQERTLQAFRRVQGWFAANKEFTANGGSTRTPALATQLEALNGVVSRASDHAAQQNTQASQSQLIAKDERELRREVLAQHMATIAKVARALRGTIPGIGVLSMPKGNIQTAPLITFATAMARKAEIYESVLVEHGLPEDFIKQLEDAVAKLKDSIDARGKARAARSGATKGLESELALGKRVLEVIDASLTRALRSMPGRFAEWKHVKRITVRGTTVRPSIVTDQGAPSDVQVLSPAVPQVVGADSKAA
jgi:hypothetical protein